MEKHNTTERGHAVFIKAIVRTVAALLMCLLVFTSLCLAESEIKIGVLAKRGPAIAFARWNALAEYLTKSTGTKHRIVPLNFKQLPDAVAKDKVDLVIANQLIYVVLAQKYGITALVTISGKKAGPYMGGVIFAKVESPISKLVHLKGKNIAAVSKRSAGGYLIQAHLLYKNGIDVYTDLTVKPLKNQDYVVYSVLNGVFDVGFVRTDQLESMENEGKIKLEQFKVIHRVEHPGFPFLCSTELWPAWPVAASKNLPNFMREKIKSALLSLPSQSEAARKAKIRGFVPAGDYGPVKQAVNDLGISF